MNWLIAHLIGDYLLQNDWMAMNKKTSDWACFVHVVLYMIPFLFCGFVWWQLLLIAVQHYALDRTNFVVNFMKWKGSGDFAKNMAPWSIIITDNVLHIVWIYFVCLLV